MITIDEAKLLKYGDILHSSVLLNVDGTPVRLRVNGTVKIWKRDASRIRIPLKHGIYNYGYATNGTFEGGGFYIYINELINSRG